MLRRLFGFHHRHEVVDRFRFHFPLETLFDLKLFSTVIMLTIIRSLAENFIKYGNFEAHLQTLLGDRIHARWMLRVPSLQCCCCCCYCYCCCVRCPFFPGYRRVIDLGYCQKTVGLVKDILKSVSVFEIKPACHVG